MKHLIIILFAVSLLSSCDSPSATNIAQQVPATKSAVPIKLACDIQALAGKSPAAVQKLYGKPDAAKPEVVRAGPCKSKFCSSYTYQNGRIEVVYINGKADWITVNKVDNYPLEASSVQALGLPLASPSFNSPDNVIRWSQISGLHEVSAFSNGSGGISYFHILAKTSL